MSEETLVALIKEHQIGSQSELEERLRAKGVQMTQSSISRTLNKLNIVKVDGVYQLPAITKGDSAVVDFLEIRNSGDTLLVLKTTPGNASRAAYIIDNANVEGIAGSLAGDDTIFIAIESKSYRNSVINKILALLQR